MKTVTATFIVDDIVAEERVQALLNDMYHLQATSTTKLKFVELIVENKEIPWVQGNDIFGRENFKHLKFGE